MNQRIRIGVLRGGPSPEYEVSLATGAAVLEVLRERLADKYIPIDVFVDRGGVCHIDGTPIDLEDLVRKVDVIFNALHGAYGEDGKIQHFLESHGIPFTGSGSLGSSLGMNKILTKKVFKDHGIKSPYWKELLSQDIAEDAGAVVKKLFHSFLLPAVIKPASGGSSVGTSVVRAYTDLEVALREAAKHGDSVIIEEYIPGIEATCGILQDFRGESLYVLPPVEIRHSRQLYDYEAKRKSMADIIAPAPFAEQHKRDVSDMARKIHEVLGLRHYSRSDFIIHPRRGIYALEVNTLPGLESRSPLVLSLGSVGSGLDELVHHLIQLSKGEKGDKGGFTS